MKHFFPAASIILLTLLFTCQPKTATNGSWNYLIEKEGSYTGLTIPKQGYDPNSINVFVTTNKIDQPILGEIAETDSSYVFQPLIPFTRGLSYLIEHKRQTIQIVTIPNNDADEPPRLVHIYPSKDTLPENLLKIYVQFSEPMSYQHSMQHITLLKGEDTVSSFLDLQNELWNPDHTLLTLWQDPGRIKRELVPNRELGNPLDKGFTYELHISDKWNSARGVPLNRKYKKQFHVSNRDDLSPDVNVWDISYSKDDQQISIHFQESLDYTLMQECFEILYGNGDLIEGKFTVKNHESTLKFTPVNRLLSGTYRLKVNTILEDLSGNNLNRPFDRKIGTGAVDEEPFVYIDFLVVDGVFRSEDIHIIRTPVKAPNANAYAERFVRSLRRVTR